MAKSAAGLDRYLSEHQRRQKSAPRMPSWLQGLRAAAMDSFAATGFPTTAREDWRFTNVAPVAEAVFEPANGATPPAVGLADRLTLVRTPASRLVFVNGSFSAGLSSTARLPAGVRFERLSAAWESGPNLIEPHLGRYASAVDHPFAALNTALFGDGTLLYVPAGVDLPEPLEVLYLSVAQGSPHVTFPRTLVILERGARARLVESYAATTTGAYFSNGTSEIVLGEGARLDHYRVQRESPAAYHIAVTRSRQERDSVLHSSAVSIGAGLARHDVGAVLDGAGASLTLNGLILARDRQHVDHHTVIDHAQPHCESHELFNGIFDDHARGVFNGRIVVRPGAQRTDSKQTSNNLLLSEDARADTQPQLEIYADDVKCTHGATLGPVDEASMFYLRSRGLDPEQARGLLTYGFGADILRRVEDVRIQEPLDRLLVEHLSGSGSMEV